MMNQLFRIERKESKQAYKDTYKYEKKGTPDNQSSRGGWRTGTV